MGRQSAYELPTLSSKVRIGREFDVEASYPNSPDYPKSPDYPNRALITQRALPDDQGCEASGRERPRP